MKIFSLFTFLFFSISCFSQISVGPRHIGKAKKFDKATLGKFKNTETIFVLSEILDRYDYTKILENSWEVTPYQIVHIGDYDIEKYIDGNYSIAQLGGYKKTSSYGGNVVTYLYVYIDITMPDREKITKKRNKLSTEKWEKKKYEIIDENSDNIARIYIHPKDEFIHTSMQYDMAKTVASLYTKDVFHDYKPGFLKNYFQKVSNLIENEEVYWMFENDYKPELKNLSSDKLYIPSYMTVEYNGWTARDSNADEENVEEIFKKYIYEYQIIADSDLSDKIMNNEELYYIRFVRINTERFLQIVNSKSGEVLYRNYIHGLGYKIKPKHIKDLNKDIEKARKK